MNAQLAVIGLISRNWCYSTVVRIASLAPTHVATTVTCSVSRLKFSPNDRNTLPRRPSDKTKSATILDPDPVWMLSTWKARNAEWNNCSCRHLKLTLVPCNDGALMEVPVWNSRDQRYDTRSRVVRQERIRRINSSDTRSCVVQLSVCVLLALNVAFFKFPQESKKYEKRICETSFTRKYDGAPVFWRFGKFLLNSSLLQMAATT